MLWRWQLLQLIHKSSRVNTESLAKSIRKSSWFRSFLSQDASEIKLLSMKIKARYEKPPRKSLLICGHKRSRRSPHLMQWQRYFQTALSQWIDCKTKSTEKLTNVEWPKCLEKQQNNKMLSWKRVVHISLGKALSKTAKTYNKTVRDRQQLGSSLSIQSLTTKGHRFRHFLDFLCDF